MLFPGLGRLHEEGNGYSWEPVIFTDRVERASSAQNH